MHKNGKNILDREEHVKRGAAGPRLRLAGRVEKGGSSLSLGVQATQSQEPESLE